MDSTETDGGGGKKMETERERQQGVGETGSVLTHEAFAGAGRLAKGADI